MTDDTHTTSSITHCRVITLAQHHHQNGNLSVVESCNELPFSVRRVYYLYDVPGGVERGGHSHHHCLEFIVAASGSFDITIDDGAATQTVHLNRSNAGLLVAPGIWRTLHNFSSGSVCLVVASETFCEADYVRSYDNFLKLTASKRNQ